MIFEFDYEINDMSEEVKSATKEQLQRALVHIGMKMHEMAVKLVPVDTGALKNSICAVDNQKNQFMSVFYHIRNAFAHGRLNMVDVDGDCVFILEDVQPNKKEEKLKVSARMIIKKSTLLRWIDIIEGGQTEYQRQ